MQSSSQFSKRLCQKHRGFNSPPDRTPRLAVSSAGGSRTPARLHGVRLVANPHSRVQSETTLNLDCVDILDTGSAITLAGDDDVTEWIKELGAGIEEVTPRPTSITHIRGIGATSLVVRWIRMTLDIGGVHVTFQDVPVLRGHRGLLLGNDFLGPGRSVISYNTDTDGTLTLRESTTLQPMSVPVPFSTEFTKEGVATFYAASHESLRQQHAQTFSAAVDFGDITAEERAARIQQQADAHEVEQILQSVTPCAWTSQTVVVPAWSEVRFKVRVPEILSKAREVAVVPLDDERREDLGVLIAPTLQNVGKDGTILLLAVNNDTKPKRIPMLTPCARFIVDPRVYDVQYEHTLEEIKEKVNIADDLTTSEFKQAERMLAARRALFRTTLGYAHPTKMSLKVNGRPPNATLRVRAPEEEEALNKEVRKQCKAGLIEPARSPYGALPMLIKKPTKPGEPQQYRVVLDYRGVNQILEKDVYPLPNLEANLSKLGKANWFTTLDLLQGFHQVELADDGSKEITAFNTPLGQFQYVRMPMGLATSPSTFMRLVDATLRGLPPGIALAYVDDVVIPTCGTFEDHMRDVGLVFDRLIEAGFAVRCDKCHIGMKEVPYLGFMVGAYGQRPMESKTQAILDIAVEDMRGNPGAAARYAGMLGFYSKFIPNLHSVIGSFHELKQKTVQADDIIGGNGKVPSLRFMSSLEHSKHLLANVTSLMRPDPQKPFTIHTDAASSCGIGAALMQQVDDDDPESLAPIAFWSRRLSDEERGYGVRDQECLGLAEALKVWRHYILNSKIKLMTDHSSLQWLLSTPHPDGSRVSGWALQAQNFDCEIHYLPGTQQVVADCLSRLAKRTEPAREEGVVGRRLDIADRLEIADTAAVKIIEGAQPPLAIGQLVESASFRPDNSPKVANRATLATLRVMNGELQVLAEKHLGILTLPSVLIDQGNEAFTYRQQLRRMMSVNYFTFSSVEQRANVVTIINDATAFRRRGEMTTQFYTAVVHSELNFEARDCETLFLKVSEANITRLADSEQALFLRLLARELGGTDVITTGKLRSWEGKFIRVLRQVTEAKQTQVTSVAVTTIAPGLPSIEDKPFGPAFCATPQQGSQALKLIKQRLLKHPHLSLAVDLEGPLGGRLAHIDLLQLAVDPGNTEEQPLIFVFDMDRYGAEFLSLKEPLRAILENPEVTKVYHCMTGDANALYVEYDIQVKGSFDTGIADCLLRGSGFNRMRGLGTVIHEFLDVPLTLKDSFKHIPRMFSWRPLPYNYFLYAYEDVAYCNQLYLVMRTALAARNLLELSLAHSAQRAPPLSLAPNDSRYQPPSDIAITLRDQYSVLLLQHSSGSASFPSGEFSEENPFDQRITALDIWRKLLGPPPKRLSLNPTQLKKARRIGQFLVFEVIVKHLGIELLRDIQAAAELLGNLPTGTRVVAQPVHVTLEQAVNPVKQPQIIIMQHLRWLVAQEPVRSAALVVESSQGTREDDLGEHPRLRWLVEQELLYSAAVVDEFGEHPQLRWLVEQQPLHSAALVVESSQGTVEDDDFGEHPQLRWLVAQELLYSAALAVESSQGTVEDDFGEHPRSFIVVGKTVEKTRAAAIVFDDDCAYCLTTQQDGKLQFPSSPIEVGGTARDAATKAFDVYGGAALRKSDPSIVGLALMPNTSRRIRQGFLDMREVGKFQDTVYFACKVPGLNELRASFVAARLPFNGFRLTATLAKRHPSYVLAKHKSAIEQLLSTSEIAAFTAAIEQAGSSQMPTSHLDSQNSGSIDVGSSGSSPSCSYSFPAAVSSATSHSTASHEDCSDEEIERLTTAATIVQYAKLMANLSPREHTEVSCLAGAIEQQPTSSSGTLGTPLDVAVPSTDEVREEQAKHPVTGEIMDYLLAKDLSLAQQCCLDDAEKAALQARCSSYHLNADGLLCCWPPKPGGKAPAGVGQQSELVVLPPRYRNALIHQYHDRLGHLGVDKVFKLLRQRFSWGTASIMRKTIQDYIRTCDACQRTKVHTHTAGEYQIGDCGQHPGDVFCGDVYYVGLQEDGYDHTLDFADLFSRRIWSVPLQGVPTSETIADVLISTVIRNGGVPSEIRSDSGSNFISQAIRLLYERMGIKITPGSAYHHQLVALVERWHRTLKQLIRIHTLAREDSSLGAGWGSKWYRCIPLMELAYNMTVNNSTGYSPFFIEHLRHPRMAYDLQRSLDRSVDLELPAKTATWVKDRLDDLAVVYDTASNTLRWNSLSAKRRYDLRRDVATWFRPGDMVVLVKGAVADKNGHQPKAAIPTLGPFVVRKALPFDEYQLSDRLTRRVSDVVHVSRLQPYFKRHPDANTSQWMNSEGPTGGRWPVHSVTDRKVTTLDRANKELGLSKGDKVLQYKIRYVGFGTQDCRWRPVQYLTDIIELTNEYDKRIPRPPAFSEEVECISRPETAIPEPSLEAKSRPRFNSQPHPGELRPAIDPLAKPAKVDATIEQVVDNTQSGGVISDPRNSPSITDEFSSSAPEASVDEREQRRQHRAARKSA